MENNVKMMILAVGIISYLKIKVVHFLIKGGWKGIPWHSFFNLEVKRRLKNIFFAKSKYIIYFPKLNKYCQALQVQIFFQNSACIKKSKWEDKNPNKLLNHILRNVKQKDNNV